MAFDGAPTLAHFDQGARKFKLRAKLLISVPVVRILAPLLVRIAHFARIPDARCGRKRYSRNSSMSGMRVKAILVPVADFS